MQMHSLSIDVLVLYVFVVTECTQCSTSSTFSHCQRLSGGSDIAAQMAEVRARRAREYEAIKLKDQAQPLSENPSMNTWSFVTSKITPSNIGTSAKKMAIGDARNFYLDQSVTIFRNRKTGNILDCNDCFFSLVTIQNISLDFCPDIWHTYRNHFRTSRRQQWLVSVLCYGRRQSARNQF